MSPPIKLEGFVYDSYIVTCKGILDTVEDTESRHKLSIIDHKLHDGDEIVMTLHGFSGMKWWAAGCRLLFICLEEGVACMRLAGCLSSLDLFLPSSLAKRASSSYEWWKSTDVSGKQIWDYVRFLFRSTNIWNEYFLLYDQYIKESKKISQDETKLCCFNTK